MMLISFLMPIKAEISDVGFCDHNQNYLYQKVNKIGKLYPIRLAAVINSVLIFKGLKRLTGWIFSYSFHH